MSKGDTRGKGKGKGEFSKDDAIDFLELLRSAATKLETLELNTKKFGEQFGAETGNWEHAVPVIRAKLQCLASYNENLMAYVGMKLLGIDPWSEEAKPIVEQLYWCRTTLDNVKVIEGSMKATLEHYTRAATDDAYVQAAPKVDQAEDSGSEDAADLLGGSSDEDDASDVPPSDSEDEDVFQPNRMNAIDEVDEDADMRERETLRKSDIARELYDMRSGAPESAPVHGVRRTDIVDEHDDQTRYEENNYTRLARPRANKANKEGAGERADELLDGLRDVEKLVDYVDKKAGRAGHAKKRSRRK